ncbi:helix-turn-helix domain-containing protein [Nonomuraea typhae]|uniref:helix-turn-helix domain-containing protein n=1 Tax=Nonomuraea typhae TaxID=2603600 RepID=UPI0012F8DF6A|nr:helix-turn-helix transcriptional regulator [Nonomuraea typhae]
MTETPPEAGNEFWDWFSKTAKGLGYRTEAALARALQTSPSTVLRWRKGTRPTIPHLLKISSLFGVRLESLLVLSGHVPADLVQDSRVPEPPGHVTPTERIIRESDLDERMAELMNSYWASRIDEERKRVQRLIELLMSDAVPLSSDQFSEEVGSILESRLSAHVTRVIVEWAQYRQSTREGGL